MRIIRFLDVHGQIRFGHDYRDGEATLLAGDTLASLQDGGRRLKVVKLLAPIQPAAILCIGLNYRQHARETHLELPEYPVLFMKNPAALNHPGDPILLPPSCMDPPLTVVSQPSYTMGIQSFDYLLAKISGSGRDKKFKEDVIFKPTLIIRKSCGFKFKKRGPNLA